MIRVIEKGYGGCRRVGGDSGKVGNMRAARGRREWHLFHRLAQMNPKSDKKSCLGQTDCTKSRERGQERNTVQGYEGVQCAPVARLTKS